MTRLIQQLKRVVDEEKRKSEDYLTRLKYLQADFENYRKRVDREIREIEEFSTSRFAKRLLPILDELDLALNSAESKSPLTEGVKMVRKNLNAALEAEGVRRIEALGKPFDPALHEAVDKVLGKRSGGEDIVVEEIRKGYLFKDKILRPSMVKVEVGMKGQARTPDEEEEEGREGGLT
ncbi:MAG TPA: nucleotide exchange factor GrpE [Nitrososphaerales archaeon]|nr:nucleotide exchange factor GrpE [Nitrososphaerales archaeon]